MLGKIFLAQKREKFKVFQFTEEMLPKFDKKLFEIQRSYSDYCTINGIRICINFWKNGNIFGYLRRYETNTYFNIGDYIGKDREGNHFVIKKEVFESKWIKIMKKNVLCSK